MNRSIFTQLGLAIGLAMGFASDAVAQEYTAKIGHLESAKQSRHVTLEKVSESVKKRTDGAVELQIFPQSQLGNQRQMTEGTQLGTIQGTVAPAAFLGGFNPAASIMDIPYLMPNDKDKAQELRESPFGQALLDSFKDKGLVAIGLWPNGRKSLTSSKPLDNISDLEGQKFRTMDSKVLIEQFNAVGASAIALPFGELYTSLQTGVVDGEENPLDSISNMKFYEVQDYLVVSEHGSMEDVILFNPAWWNSLPQEYRVIIEDTFHEYIPAMLEHKTAAVNKALETIKDSDINVRTASAEERNAFRKKAFGPASQAYIELAGDKLLNIYQREYDKIMSN